MPAKNCDHVRPLQRQQGQSKIEDWAAIAEDTTCFATQVIDWCMKEHPANDWNGAYKMVFVTLLRHTAELLDALPQAIANRQIAVCHILLRSLLEAAMSLLFILKDDTDRRAEAYLYMDSMRAISRRDLQDNQSGRFEEYDRIHRADLILGPAGAEVAPDLEELRKRRTREIELLRTMPNAGPEYERLKKLPRKKRPRNIEWYMFFSNVRTIRQMAMEVNLGGTYDFLYSRYSGKIHPQDVIQDNITHNPAKNEFIAVPLRSIRTGQEATAAREIVAISSKCAMLCFASYSERYLNSRREELLNWWQEHSAAQKRLSDLISSSE